MLHPRPSSRVVARGGSRGGCCGEPGSSPAPRGFGFYLWAPADELHPASCLGREQPWQDGASERCPAGKGRCHPSPTAGTGDSLGTLGGPGGSPRCPGWDAPAELDPPKLRPVVLQGWDPLGSLLSPPGMSLLGDPPCPGTEGWVEAQRDGCPAPNAGTRCAWHLLGTHRAASPRWGPGSGRARPHGARYDAAPPGVQSGRG